MGEPGIEAQSGAGSVGGDETSVHSRIRRNFARSFPRCRRAWVGPCGPSLTTYVS